MAIYSWFTHEEWWFYIISYVSLPEGSSIEKKTTSEDTSLIGSLIGLTKSGEIQDLYNRFWKSPN